MSNMITPTVFYRTLNVEGLEILYREAVRTPDSSRRYAGDHRRADRGAARRRPDG